MADVLFFAPVTTGSQHDPLPIGKWKVTGVQQMPAFHYNPDLFWDASPAHSKAKIPPGPNNPVGVAWIDLSKPHYGIHGTPEPSQIGHVQSHGCVRMTNWDVRRVMEWAGPARSSSFNDDVGRQSPHAAGVHRGDELSHGHRHDDRGVLAAQRADGSLTVTEVHASTAATAVGDAPTRPVRRTDAACATPEPAATVPPAPVSPTEAGEIVALRGARL